MITKNSTQQDDDVTISVKDLVLWQANLKKDIDFDKPNDQLTLEERVDKHIYHAIDKTVEEKIGADAKKVLDEQNKEMELISKLQINISKLV
ncbi:MAG: hypothetical protein V1707_03520, partial [bacterium]